MVAHDFVELHNNTLKDTVAEEVVDLETFASDVDCELKGYIKKFHKIEFSPGATIIPFWESATSESPVLQELCDIASPLPHLPYPAPLPYPPCVDPIDIDEGEEPVDTTHGNYPEFELQALEILHAYYSNTPSSIIPSTVGGASDPQNATPCPLCGVVVSLQDYCAHYMSHL